VTAGDQVQVNVTNQSMPGSSAILMNATSPLLGGDAGDVKYPYYLINGRVPTAPVTFIGKPGSRARIRFINAGGDTAFRSYYRRAERTLPVTTRPGDRATERE